MWQTRHTWKLFNSEISFFTWIVSEGPAAERAENNLQIIFTNSRSEKMTPN